MTGRPDRQLTWHVPSYSDPHASALYVSQHHRNEIPADAPLCMHTPRQQMIGAILRSLYWIASRDSARGSNVKIAEVTDKPTFSHSNIVTTGVRSASNEFHVTHQGPFLLITYAVVSVAEAKPVRRNLFVLEACH